MCADVFLRTPARTIQKSFFFAITQVACIAQPRNNIRVSIQFRIDSSTPQGSLFLRKNFLDMFYSLSAGYYRSNMYVRRRSLGQQGFICIFHRSTRSKHRIGKNQCFSIQFWRSDVFDMNVEMIFIDVFAVSRYESILGMVEIIDESSVERKPCTQNGRNNPGMFSTASASGVRITFSS